MPAASPPVPGYGTWKQLRRRGFQVGAQNQIALQRKRLRFGKEPQQNKREVTFVKKRRERYDVRGDMERIMGVEPTSTAWEAVVLPMNYIRESLAIA